MKEKRTKENNKMETVKASVIYGHEEAEKKKSRRQERKNTTQNIEIRRQKTIKPRVLHMDMKSKGGRKRAEQRRTRKRVIQDGREWGGGGRQVGGYGCRRVVPGR